MNLLNFAPGQKTIAAAVIGLLTLLAVNLGGIPVAGIEPSPNWVMDAWNFVLIIFLRKGMAS